MSVATDIVTVGKSWTMAHGWPVPDEVHTATLAREIGLALEDDEIVLALKRVFSEHGAVTVEDLKQVPYSELLDSIDLARPEADYGLSVEEVLLRQR